MRPHPRSLARAVALAALLGLGAWTTAPVGTAQAPAYAPAIPYAPPNPAVTPQACAPLVAEDGRAFGNRMGAFETVYGKPALDWTEEDFAGLDRLLEACREVKVRGDTLNYNGWRSALDASRDVVLPDGLLARQVDAYARSIGSDGIRLPRCLALLDFRDDRYTLEDNSKAIFGESLLAATDDDLNRVVLYANQCLTYLPDVAFHARSMRGSETSDRLGILMDKALLVVKRRQDWAEWRRRDSDLVLDVGGVVIPPTMTSPKAREMIERFDRASAPGRRFTPEQVSFLVRMADEVIEDNKSAYDLLYAEAVQKRVHDQIFTSVETTPSPSR